MPRKQKPLDLVAKNKTMKRWLFFSIFGLVLTGFGLSLLGEAIIAKFKGEPWFWIGTQALLVFNSGLSCVGQGVIERVKMLKLNQ
jgi:hypothetical protein